MSAQPDLVFSPWTGAPLGAVSARDPDAYRTSKLNRWGYNPWTGEARPTHEIDFDPMGYATDHCHLPAPSTQTETAGLVFGGVDVAAFTDSQFGAKSAPVKDSNPKTAAGDAKVPLYLCSPIAMAEWSLAQFAGMEKYGLVNWREAGVRASTYVSAMLRHVEAFNAGEDRDPDDDTDHLGNVMACCAILLEARALGLLTDDRPRAIAFREAWRGVQTRMSAIREKYADRHPTNYTIERDKALPTDE